MVKPPKTRHSKVHKDPVTIDLDPAEVKRETNETATTEAAATGVDPAASADEHVKPNAADEALAAEEPSEDAEPPNAATVGDEAGAAEGPSEPFQPESVEQHRRSGAASAFAAGLAGAALALVGAAGLQQAGIWPAAPDDSSVAQSMNALRTELDALRQQVAAGSVTPDPALAQSVSQSGERIEAVAASLDRLRAEVAQQATQERAAADPAALQALERRLEELEAAAGTANQAVSQIGSLSEQVAQLNDSFTSFIQEAADQSNRLDALDERVAALDQSVEAQAAEPGMAFAVAATALKSAIDRGTPFMMELETYAAIAPATPQIAALRDLAASGVPTPAEIEAAAPDAASRMLAAATPVENNAGFLERMFTSARSIVEVRPVGSVEGDTPGAVLARMEVALREGDYAKAIEEYETLPREARAAGQEFIDRVKARLAADRLIAEAISGAVTTPGQEG